MTKFGRQMQNDMPMTIDSRGVQITDVSVRGCGSVAIFNIRGYPQMSSEAQFADADNPWMQTRMRIYFR